MDIKEIALKIAKELPMDKRFSVEQICVECAEALVAEIQCRGEPKYIVTWLEGICTLEAVGDADLPVEFTELFTFPPSIEALEDKVAEACAALLEQLQLPDLYSQPCIDNTVSDIRSGEWKKFRKGE